MIHEATREPAVLRDVIRRRGMRAVWLALTRLEGAAAGRYRFRADHQFRACVALARLAPALLYEDPNVARDAAAAREWWTPERIAELEEFDRQLRMTPEEREAEDRAAELARPRPPEHEPFASAEEASRWFREVYYPWEKANGLYVESPGRRAGGAHDDDDNA